MSLAAVLAAAPNVNLHFTPTDGKPQNEVIDRGIFTSVADLKHEIKRQKNTGLDYSRPA